MGGSLQAPQTRALGLHAGQLGIGGLQVGRGLAVKTGEEEEEEYSEEKRNGENYFSEGESPLAEGDGSWVQLCFIVARHLGSDQAEAVNSPFSHNAHRKLGDFVEGFVIKLL